MVGLRLLTGDNVLSELEPARADFKTGWQLTYNLNTGLIRNVYKQIGRET